MIIDAHQHFWRIGANDCTWPTRDLGAIHRDFLPADLEAQARPLGVGGAVLVQSQESDRDTDWLCELAETAPFVQAVVGWADLKGADAAARIETLARRPKLRGLRPMLQGLPKDWILDRDLEPAIEAMKARGLTLDALVYTRHLPALRAFASHHPDLPIVIDHCAKPPIAEGTVSPWREEMSALAKLENVYCKFSGLLTEAQGSPPEALAAYASHVVRAFPPERLMWGSDWPVLNLAAGYGDWFDLACALSEMSGADLDWLLGGAARAFYRLP
jgi:L-fuconolactonase